MTRYPAACLAGLLALLPVACSPKQAAAPDTSSAVSSLPDCAGLKDADLDAGGRADCRETIPDDSGLVAEFRFGETANGQTPATIGILSPDGTLLQTISAMIEAAYGLPQFQDLDEDGRADLMVPLMTGNVNTAYAVWQVADGDTPYIEAGELSGVEIGYAGDGLISATGRSSANSWETGYYIFDGEKLAQVAGTRTVLYEDGTEACTAFDAGGLDAIGLTLDEAQQKFCTPAEDSD